MFNNQQNQLPQENKNNGMNDKTNPEPQIPSIPTSENLNNDEQLNNYPNQSKTLNALQKREIQNNHLDILNNGFIHYNDTEKEKTNIKPSCNKKLWIIISIISILVVAAIIIIIVVLSGGNDNKGKKKENSTDLLTFEPIINSTDIQTNMPTNDPTNNPTYNSDNTVNIDSSDIEEKTYSDIISEPTGNKAEVFEKPLNSEYEFNTKLGDLKRISVVQKSNDESKFSDQIINTKLTRKTNYDIFILSEEEAPEEDKLFYSKMYTGAISIVSECFTIEDDENCTLKEMVDLTKIKEDPNNIRILDEDIDFKDIPLAICLFNITNNDFVTSMTCHKSFKEIKRHEILLDLYFYRSPAIERKDKVKDNITITINEDKENNRKLIREQNGGLCKIENSWGSLCTTDMNITTDLKGNFISYDEIAITDIKYNQYNSFKKNKRTNLVDNSGKITKEDALIYKKNLEKLLEKMKPYMKEEIEFKREEFIELFNLIRYNTTKEKNDDNIDKINNEESFKKRRLKSRDAIQYIKEKELFHIDSLGVQANLNLIINSGLNTDFMSSQSKFIFDINQKEEVLYDQKQLSNIQEIIDELRALSKAGNHLATELYDKIYDKLENLPNEMSIQLRSLNDLLKFYDLIPIFNHTLSTISYNKLPPIIVELSNEMLSKLSGLYTNLKIKGDVKEKVENLGDNLYDYVNNTNDIVDMIYLNIKELINTLNTKNNPFTEITNYYLNNTAESFYKIIKSARKIFDTYFISEYDFSYPQIEELIQLFEEKSEEVLRKDKEYILDMYNKLKDKYYTISSISEEDYDKVLSNILNYYNYTSDIIIKIKNYIIEIIDIKDSGYYLTKEEIKKRNETFNLLLDEALEVAKKLNKDGLIDKVFDQIMIKFKESYIEIMKYMTEKKSEYFSLQDNVLNESLFTNENKKIIESKIYNYTNHIISTIKREVDYKKKAKNYLDQFMKDNLSELNDIISDLELLLSEEALQNLVDAFEISLNQSLINFTSNIDKNIALTKEYYDHFINILYDNQYLLSVIKEYHVEEIPKIHTYFGNMRRFIDEIKKKHRTSTYLSKYNRFISVWNYTEKYLKNQLYSEILENYKNIYNNIKEMLQSIINLESLKNYIDDEDLEFTKEHIKIIEKLQNRIDNYFSKEIFDLKYNNYIEEIKNKYKEVINDINTFIKQKNVNIIELEEIEDHVNDFCIQYSRKICYGSSSCVWNTYIYDTFCMILTPYENNYLEINNHPYDIVENNNNFKYTLNDLVSKINEKIDEYNYHIKYLENNLNKIKNETLIFDYNFSNDYLNSYAEWINNELNNHFENQIIRSTYDYYYNQIKIKFEDILNNIVTKWKNAYKILAQEVSFNFRNIKYTIYEFGLMGDIYQSILKTNLISNYFNSIILFEKSEFNYTITNYHYYLYKLVNDSYNSILSNFPKGENEINDMLIQRKNETIIYFESLLNNISESNITTTNLEYQKSILNVNEEDFFKVNSLIQSKIEELDEYIEDRIDDVVEFELFHSSLEINQYGLASRFYLENKEFGKLIEEIYGQVDSGTFFYLDFTNFKDIMSENWIVDSRDFINILNDALYLTNKEIKNELNIKLESYIDDIQNDIKKYFKKDIENIINDLYSNNIKNINTFHINNIKNIIKTILTTIKQKIKTEMEKIKTKNSYRINTINNTMQSFKELIIDKLNETISDVLNEFYQNMNTNVYSNCIDNNLNQYLNIVKEETNKKEFNEFKMLNSSYKVGEIIFNLTQDIVNKFKRITNKNIYFKYVEYYNKIKYSIKFTEIQDIINDEIDDIYKNEILNVINAVGDESLNDEFDLDITLKQEINEIIKTKMNEIKNEISTIKGSNFQVNYKCPLDFSISNSEMIKSICESFKNILSIENEEQGTKINEYIQNTITSNLNNFLKNVIHLFGDEFFDRIIDYNINFKILDLYDNLVYALGQILLYYSALGKYRDNVKELPLELKYRLYRLNDLDYIIESKKDDIIYLLEEKLNELILNLKNVAKDKYTYYFEENKIIKDNFDSSIIKVIKNNLIEIMPQIEKEYNNALEKYLKVKFIDSFKDILNEKTYLLLNQFYEEKKRLINELDTLFSLKSDKDLNEVFRNINNTIYSMRDYSKYLRTFSISDETKIFLSNYANNTIVPLFYNFRNDLENNTYMLIEETINNNSITIERINIKEFYNKAYELMDYFRDNFYTPILKALEEYYLSYHINIEDKKNLYLNGSKLRRLVDDDGTNIENKRQETKDVEETFSQIYQLALNAKNSFDYSILYFNLVQNLNVYISNNNFNYKYLKKWITDNKYNFRIHNFLMNKLNKLYHIIDNYYAYSKVGHLDFRTHMITYIEQIYSKALICRTITANTLNNQYKDILAKTNSFNVTYSNYREEIITCDYKHKTEHMINRGNAYITNINEYSEFKLETSLEGNLFKTPRINVKIVDKTRPDNLLLNIRAEYGFCGRTGYLYDVNFNDANYTMSIEFNTKTNNINITTFTNFESYNYTSQMYQIPDSYYMDNITYMGYTIHFEKSCYNEYNRNLTDIYNNEVEAKHYKETMIIVG